MQSAALWLATLCGSILSSMAESWVLTLTYWELLTLSTQPEHPCENADRITLRHLTAVDQRITQLAALRAELALMLDSCSGGRVADCQILESLSTN
ncbi:MerR family DNA-binding protein [Nitrobacter sp. TKz-YC01]|uniref:MerR family DNA-binding protein n=1 Tax=Nitrobacter sp. TKz-YC01 TaxID=3398703 RepID=UPI003A1039CF